MATTTFSTEAIAAIAAHRLELSVALAKYHASNPRIFGSVARGDATETSDLDILVDLDPEGGNPLLRLAALGEEFRYILGRDVDVVASDLLRDTVARTVLADSIAF